MTLCQSQEHLERNKRPKEETGRMNSIAKRIYDAAESWGKIKSTEMQLQHNLHIPSKLSSTEECTFAS